MKIYLPLRSGHLPGGARYRQAKLRAARAANGVEPPLFRWVPQSGMATVIFIALLALMLMMITFEATAIFRLGREEKLLEANQIKRMTAMQTNHLPSTVIRP